jgi:hypothetical protein
VIASIVKCAQHSWHGVMPGHWAGGRNLDAGPARDQDDRPAARRTGVCGGVVQGRGEPRVPLSLFPRDSPPPLPSGYFLQPATGCLQLLPPPPLLPCLQMEGGWPPDNLLCKSRLPLLNNLLCKSRLPHDSRNHCMVYPIPS